MDLYENAERLLDPEPVTERVEAVVGRARCARLQGDLQYSVYLLERTLGELERSGLSDPEALLRLHASLVPPYFQLGAASADLEASLWDPAPADFEMAVLYGASKYPLAPRQHRTSTLQGGLIVGVTIVT